MLYDNKFLWSVKIVAALIYHCKTSYKMHEVLLQLDPRLVTPYTGVAMEFYSGLSDLHSRDVCI